MITLWLTVISVAVSTHIRILFNKYEPEPVQTVHVGTFQYGEWDATQESLDEQHARQTETEDPPFPTPSDEKARQATLNSDVHVPVNANELEAPSGLTDEELEKFADEGGFKDYPEPAPEQDTTNPSTDEPSRR